MSFYQSIAKYYNFIFPFSKVTLDFLRKYVKKSDKILDIGCATGELSKHLRSITSKVDAFDLDSEMIEIAKQDSKEVNFSVENMLNIDKKFQNNHYDHVICFGNTVVHLNSLADIEALFSKVNKALNKNGKFIFQIINYDRILKDKVNFLPTIDNDKINFKRDYIHLDNGKVAFKTELNVKFNDDRINNSIDLLALKHSEIINISSKTGFQISQIFGNFMGAEYNENSYALVAVLEKK